jgi:predicted dehydrogenase
VRTPVSVGVIGAGAGALTLARVFDESPRAEVRWLDDRLDPAELDAVLGDESVDAVVLAAPASVRAALTRGVLEAGKHVYVQGPLAAPVGEVEKLLALAAARDRRLMVGHVLLFHPAIRKLKELIELGRLGDVYYLTAVVLSAQRGREDGGVLTSLAGEAVAVLLYLLGDEPVRVQGAAESYVRPGAAELVSGYLRFATGITVMLQLSALDAREQSRFAVVGSRKTGVFDGAAGRPLTIYERGSSRGAEIVSPRLPPVDPLRAECESFLAGVRVRAAEFPATRLQPAVARVLEALAPPDGAAAAPSRERPRLRLALAERVEPAKRESGAAPLGLRGSP